MSRRDHVVFCEVWAMEQDVGWTGDDIFDFFRSTFPEGGILDNLIL